MYLTILTKPKYKQITLEDLLNNPYISMDDIPDVPQKKITVEISEEYGNKTFSEVLQEVEATEGARHVAEVLTEIL